jgi:hypothetical protein
MGKQKNKKLWLWTSLTFVVVIALFLIHDIIITNILAYRICKADPDPKTYINQTVEYPESIYWEDNIYPGFDENDRLLMIRNYLDGVHLRTMALNAPDGTIHVFNATVDDWRQSSIIQKETEDDWKNYFKTLDNEAKKIAEQGQTYTREAMPQLNYSIIFNVIPLTTFEHRYLWSDEVVIMGEKSIEPIAYNRRLMRRWYMVFPDIALGSRYYSSKAMCGLDGWLYEFDRKVFPMIRPRVGKYHGMNINYYLYKKFN